MLSRLFSSRNGHPEPDLYFTTTRDGVRLALYNYAPESPVPGRLPVFLCHGLGSNRYDLDYPGRQSLAKYLHRQGFDVWLVELRGAGKSTSPSPLNGRRYAWVFDDYIHHDIPAAIRFIKLKTGAPALHWIGHSMGGMLAYPFLVGSNPHLIQSCITVGAPSLILMGEEAPRYLVHLKRLLKYIPYFPYRDVVRVLSPLLPLVEGIIGTYFYNPENMDRKVVQTLIRTALHNLPTSLMLQAIDWYENQECRSYYGTFSFTENLSRIETPLLVIGGAVDELTPPEDLKEAYDRVSSPEKEFVVMGTERGDAVDYGHVDLILGKNAPDEVFPLIRDWLEEHDPSTPQDKAAVDGARAASIG